MVISRGEIWWATLSDPAGSEPGFRRPILIVQDDAFNRSKIQTTICLVLSSNMRLALAPGNVAVSKKESRLSKDSVINVSQVVTVDRRFLSEKASRISAKTMKAVDSGLRLALGLGLIGR